MSVEFEEKVLAKLDAIDQRFEKLEAKVDEHHDDTMQTLRDYEENFRDITRKIDALDSRVQNVESIVSMRWDIPKLSDRIDALDHEVGKHTIRLNKLEHKTGAAAN